jgi:hypothetical protein
MTDTDHTRQQADAAAKKRDEDTKKHAEDTKKKLADEREARDKSAKAGTREGVAGSKPTPTQEENDLAASGVHVMEHEDDGSGPDPNSPEAKQSEANKAPQQRGGYATRQATPSARHE